MEERLCLNRDLWIGYDRLAGSDDSWEFIGSEHNEDPAAAARVLAVTKWASGKHFILVAGLQGAYEYEITLDTKGPVV